MKGSATARARVPAVALSVVVLALAGGCGDDEPSARELGRTVGQRLAAAEDRGSEACALLAPAEVAEEIGGPVAEGVPSGDACRFEVGEDQASPGSGEVIVGLPMRMTGVEPAVWFESMRPVAGAREVDGVGDAAFYEPRTATLTAISGEVVFTIRAKVIPEPPDVVERLRALGVAAGDRIDT